MKMQCPRSNTEGATTGPPGLRALALLLAMALSACGGSSGDGGAPQTTWDTVDVTTSSAAAGASTADATGTDTNITTGNEHIAVAGPVVSTARPSAADLDSARSGDELIQLTQQFVNLQHTTQARVLADIYGNTTQAVSVPQDSVTVSPISRLQAVPLVVTESGNVLASISQRSQGRAIGYGVDMLGWMAGTTAEQQHLPLFTRAFTWMITGTATGRLPAQLRFAVAGYDANTVRNFLTRVGVKGEQVTCDLTIDNNCWKNIDLLVFGKDTKNSPGLADRVSMYQSAGKSMMYLHPGWWQVDAGREVLKGMGMSLAGYPGNYFAGPTERAVESGRTPAQSVQRAATLGDTNLALTTFRTGQPPANEEELKRIENSISNIGGELANMGSSGRDLLKDPGLEMYRRLVLWADKIRPTLAYGTADRSKDPMGYLRLYAADNWLWFARRSTTAMPGGQGDYMPAAAQQLPTIASEEVTVVLPQGGGSTLIGRGAKPAGPLRITVLDAGGATSLSIQTSLLRAWGNVRSGTYVRPARPHSFAVALNPDGKPTDFVAPNGGPLFLNYYGVKPGSKVRLRLEGAVRYAHFDFINGSMDPAELNTAIESLKRGDFGWSTAKLVGGEIQQTIGYARQAIGNLPPQEYVDRIKQYIFDTNHMANGYNNIPLSASATAVCQQLGWDCTGEAHRAPGVQHFVGWIATCGFLCSGNPSDGFVGIDLGWGWAHELGHNTVQRILTVTPDGKGCTTECNNNILAGLQMMRTYAKLSLDFNGGHFGYRPLFTYIQASRATGKTGEALRADMQNRLWTGAMTAEAGAQQAVHMQLSYLYSKLRLKLAKPTIESTLDYFRLINAGDRLVARGFKPEEAGRYGMARFPNNNITSHDLLYTLSSRIIGADLRDYFAMVGLPLKAESLQSVADLRLPAAPLEFFALPDGKGNQLSTGRWTSIAAANATYPTF